MLIDELINSSSVTRFTDDDGVVYGLRVLGRGENLFFQERDKGLICVFDAVNSALYTKSIKFWGEKEKISKEERARVVKLIVSAYQRIFKKTIVVIDSGS